MKVTLRYFDVTARAQPLRDALACARVAFEDVRISTTDWPSKRADPGFSGPHGSLPTLTWDGATIGETLPIATFVASRLGERQSLDDRALAVRDAVVSSAYLEIIARLGEIVWASVLYPGVEAPRAFAARAPRILQKLERIDTQYAAEAPLRLPRPKPCVADFFAREALTIVRRVLGDAREDRLQARLPRLFELDAWLASELALVGGPARRPTAFTARPDEEAVMATLRAVDVSASL
ncbi:MAG TPA: hypothetical protein VKU41_05175 [Polyangiaceae bacterium]|nr:hypothetical protein [Polyangiaceae bacterium]